MRLRLDDARGVFVQDHADTRINQFLGCRQTFVDIARTVLEQHLVLLAAFGVEFLECDLKARLLLLAELSQTTRQCGDHTDLDRTLLGGCIANDRDTDGHDPKCNGE